MLVAPTNCKRSKGSRIPSSRVQDTSIEDVTKILQEHGCIIEDGDGAKHGQGGHGAELLTYEAEGFGFRRLVDQCYYGLI